MILGGVAEWKSVDFGVRAYFFLYKRDKNPPPTPRVDGGAEVGGGLETESNEGWKLSSGCTVGPEKVSSSSFIQS